MEIINVEKMNRVAPIVPLCATDALKPPHNDGGSCIIKNLCIVLDGPKLRP